MQKKITLFFLLIAVSQLGYSQQIAVKSNPLYWAMLGTLNAEGEMVVGSRSSVSMRVGYNPWTFSENKKMKHLSVMPTYRYWWCAPMEGHFVSAQLEYAHFNVGNIDFPGSVWKPLNDERMQGDMVAVGLSYGYHLILSRRWSLEAEFGLGVAYAAFQRYNCATCGTKLGDDNKLFVKPTRAAVSLVYLIK